MTVIAFLPVLVFVLGLALYFFCSGGIKKGTVAEVGRILILCGCLAWLMSAGAQSCTMGTGGGGSAQHH